MTTQRLNMMVALMTVLVTVGFAGCRYHGHGFVVHQLGTPCNECSTRNHTLHYVDRTPDSPHFSMTSNAAPPSQYSKGVITVSPSSNRDSSEPSLLVPQPAVLVPVEEPSFQLLPPNPLELPAVTRKPFSPGQKGTLVFIPASGSKLQSYSIRRRSPVSKPVALQKSLVPQVTNRNGVFQKIKSGFLGLFPKKQVQKGR